VKRKTKAQLLAEEKFIDPAPPAMYSDVYSIRIKGVWLGAMNGQYLKAATYKSIREEFMLNSPTCIRWGLAMYDTMLGANPSRNILAYGLTFLPLVPGLVVMAPTIYSENAHTFLTNHQSQAFTFKGVVEDFNQRGYYYEVDESKLLGWVMTGDTLNQPILKQKGARVVNNQ